MGVPRSWPDHVPLWVAARPHLRYSRLHTGTDLAGGGEWGPIYAAHAGTVVDVFQDGHGGWTIDIDHGSEIVTRYKHMWAAGILVKAGAQVTAGQQIAKVGSSGYSTGAHLHFEVRVKGKAVDAAEFLSKVGITIGQ